MTIRNTQSVRVSHAAIAAAIALGATIAASSAVIQVTIGDDDGFGGTQPLVPTPPGSGYVTFTARSIAPGSHANAAATDVATIAPWTPYVFTFDFAIDLSNLACVSSAVFELQAGSLARRSDGSGYGFATVTATASGGSLPLGDLLTESTGAAGSAAEEVVRLLSFDLIDLIDELLGETDATISILIDGSALTAPVDLMAFDFARLTIIGSPLDPLCVADLNCDGTVDGADLGVLLSQWGQRGPADLNGDGTVDGADLGTLLASWGACAE